MKPIQLFAQRIALQESFEYVMYYEGFLWFNNDQQAIVLQTEQVAGCFVYERSAFASLASKTVLQYSIREDGVWQVETKEQGEETVCPLSKEDMKKRDLVLETPTFLETFDYLGSEKQHVSFRISKKDLQAELQNASIIAAKYNKSPEKLVAVFDLEQESFQLMNYENAFEPFGPEKMILEDMSAEEEPFYVYYLTLHNLLWQTEEQQGMDFYSFEYSGKGYLKIYMNKDLSCVALALKKQ